MISVLAIVLALSTSLLAQSCPTTTESEKGTDAAQMSILHGRLVYHDELRKWIGAKLDKPACGQQEIQLVFTDDAEWRRAESLRGCSVTVSGKLFNSPTAYYSADLVISNPVLRPDSRCRPFPLTADLSKIPIPSTVHRYEVSITVDYRGKGHVAVHVTGGPDETTPLRPWQAYAHYMLTGGADVIWFGCEKDFQLEKAKQQPPGPGILPGDDDAGASLQNMGGVNTISYSCRRRQKSR